MPDLDALGWLRSVLWAPEVEVAFEAGAAGDRTFLAEPSVTAPRLLVPATPAAATATVARRTSDARSLPERLRSLAVEPLAAAGLVPRLAPGRLVSLRTGAGDRDPTQALPAHLAALLGLDDVVYAVTLGGERYNRKPVLTLFDGAGRLVAFAKVGADALTDDFVRNETRWLTELGGRTDVGFAAPAVLSSGDWRGHPVLVTAPVVAPRVPARVSVERPPDGTVAAIAAAGPVAVEPVPRTAVVHDTRGVDDPSLAGIAAGLSERHGGTQVRTGLWHGDLTPWNLASRRRRPPLIWDWEAAAPRRPIGADQAHWRVMVATHLDGATPADAIGRLTPDDIGDGQADDAARAAALDLYLLDLARRDLEILARGIDANLLPGIGRAALDRLVDRD